MLADYTHHTKDFNFASFTGAIEIEIVRIARSGRLLLLDNSRGLIFPPQFATSQEGRWG